MYETSCIMCLGSFSAAPARLPSFHCCVGTNEERLTPEWYEEHGIVLVLGTRVKSAYVRRKKLLTAAGEFISYKYLIVATGARALRLEEFGVRESPHAPNVCYLRDLSDAQKLVDVMQSCSGGNAVVVGGGYISMECAAPLVMNKLNVTMVFPGAHCMIKLFTPEIARFYESYYQSKGVKFIKGTGLASFDINTDGKMTAVNLRDGSKLQADIAVIGVGVRPNTSLFEGQLTMEKGGIRVNGKMQSSDSSVYAIGDVAAYPIKLFGETRRLEHVDSARKTARHAVSAIMEPENTYDLDYLPLFYSRAFELSWQFYGDKTGKVVHFGDLSGKTIGAYWIDKGRLVGSFLEGGTKEEYEAMAQATRLMPKVDDLGHVERQGLDFALSVSKQAGDGPVVVVLEKPSPPNSYVCWHAVAGVVAAAASIAVFAYWYGRWW